MNLELGVFITFPEIHEDWQLLAWCAGCL